MTKTHAGIWRHWSKDYSPVPAMSGAIKQGFRQLFLLLLPAMFFSTVMSTIQPEQAHAQSSRNHTVRTDMKGVNNTRVLRRKSRKRARVRATHKPKKSLFGGLFDSKPQQARKPKPFQGLKSFFESFQGATNNKPSPSSMRTTYEKRMRDAAQNNGLSSNRHMRSGFGETVPGWGFDPVRASSGERGFSSKWGKGRYRTMCVRMCDGYYFPVSFKATSGELASDAYYCNANCYNAPTKLFYYSNPGGSIEEMRSMDGTRYADIANAFKYREKYVADCRCKAEPWSRQARQQHKSWGLEEQIRQEETQKPRNGPGEELDLSSARQASSPPS